MSGTGLKDHNCYDLGKIVLNEISNKLYYSLTNKVDYVAMGNVIQDSKTTNIARESMLLAIMIIKYLLYSFNGMYII